MDKSRRIPPGASNKTGKGGHFKGILPITQSNVPMPPIPSPPPSKDQPVGRKPRS